MDRVRLSPYQQNIMDALEYSKRNLLIEAKAGSGKTSTLIMIADKIVSKNKKCLFLAFNKSIVDELRSRITSKNCEIKTIHSLGYSMIKNYLYRKYGSNTNVNINSKRPEKYINLAYEKVYKECVEDLYEDEDERKKLRHTICSSTLALINYLRFNLADLTRDDIIQNVIDQYDLQDQLERVIHLNKNISYYDFVVSIIDKMDKDFVENEPGEYEIDFNDMIWLPARLNMSAPYFLNEYLDYVLVDESQDLNKLEQQIVKKLGENRQTRFIFVGDSRQAIYQFAGADNHSIYNIKDMFNADELPLNICYRCPENVIRLAQMIVPSIDWNRNREDKGNVEFIEEENFISKLQPNDVILGRYNSSLLSCFIDITLKHHKQVKFKNKQLVKAIYDRIDWLIYNYVERYNKGLNIERKYYSLIKDKELSRKTIEENGFEYDEDHKEQLLKAALIKEEGNIEKEKSKKRKNYNLEYIRTCMKEYEEKCLPLIENDEDLKNCNDTVQDLIGYYKGIKYFVDFYIEKFGDAVVKDLLFYIKDFLNANENKDVPLLSSIHMMKGGEADNIFILDYPTLAANCKKGDSKVNKNLYYVAVTRAKKNLYLVYKKGEENLNEAMMDVKLALKPFEDENKKEIDIKKELNVQDVL